MTIYTQPRPPTTNTHTHDDTGVLARGTQQKGHMYTAKLRAARADAVYTFEQYVTMAPSVRSKS